MRHGACREHLFAFLCSFCVCFSFRSPPHPPQLFVSLCRSLGFLTRLVVSLQPGSFRFTAEELTAESSQTSSAAILSSSSTSATTLAPSSSSSSSALSSSSSSTTVTSVAVPPPTKRRRLTDAGMPETRLSCFPPHSLCVVFQ